MCYSAIALGFAADYIRGQPPDFLFRIACCGLAVHGGRVLGFKALRIRFQGFVLGGSVVQDLGITGNQTAHQQAGGN